MNISEEYMNQQADLLVKNDSVSRELFDEYGVKRDCVMKPAQVY